MREEPIRFKSCQLSALNELFVPEKELILKMIERAILDLNLPLKSIYHHTAYDWLFNTNKETTQRELSFQFCCETLGFDIQLLRASIVKRIESGKRGTYNLNPDKAKAIAQRRAASIVLSPLQVYQLAEASRLE